MHSPLLAGSLRLSWPFLIRSLSSQAEGHLQPVASPSRTALCSIACACVQMCVCVGVQAHVVGIGADCSFPLCLSSPHCCSVTLHHCSVEIGVCGGGCRRHNGLFMFWKEEFKAHLKAESRQKSPKCQYSGASHLGLCSLRPPSPRTWLLQSRCPARPQGAGVNKDL